MYKDDMEKEGHAAKKSSLMALHKLMKDLHHKSMASSPKEEPHVASMEIDIEHAPVSESEHDEENKGLGVNPFDDSQMEGDQAAELADHSHEVEDSEEHPEVDDEDNSELKLPDSLHAMIAHHLSKKK